MRLGDSLTIICSSILRQLIDVTFGVRVKIMTARRISVSLAISPFHRLTPIFRLWFTPTRLRQHAAQVGGAAAPIEVACAPIAAGGRYQVALQGFAEGRVINKFEAVVTPPHSTRFGPNFSTSCSPATVPTGG